MASMDEFWQLFTGRGASILDILLDLSGYATACVLLMLAAKGNASATARRKVLPL